MKELLISLKNSNNQPKYQLLAEALRSAIRDGKVKPGEVIPSTRTLAHKFHMNRHTVMKALGELEAEGWLQAFQKKHYQVVATLPSKFLQAKTLVAMSLPPKENIYRFARALDIADYPSGISFKHSFPSGFPDVRLFPLNEFKSYLYDSLSSHKNLTYGDPAGHPRLISQIQDYLRRVRNVDKREIVITNGSQEAIFYLAQLLLTPGDYVAVEALGYPPAREALKFAGAKLLPVAVDQEGLVVENLKKLVKTKKIKLLYLTPLHQYPTTVTLSAQRRLELYDICYKNNILILEDDYDHEFHFASQPIAPLASFDPAGIVFYVSTFSKILFPSARVGFMAVPKPIERQVAKLKRISSRQNEQLLQDTIARWMESGGFEKHLRKMRRVYDERRNSMLGELTRLQKVQNISWLSPDGGMALWLDIGRDSTKLAHLAHRNGIAINPESNFRLDKKAGSHLRLGFSGQTPEENKLGLQALFSLIKES